MNERKMQFRVGVIMLATVLIAGILLALFNEPQDLFPWLVPGGRYTVKIRFDEAPNVDKYTPVRKSGIRIGRVSDIELLDEGGVLISTLIDRNRRLRHNERFEIHSSLLAEAVLEVVRDERATDTSFIEDGEVVKGVVVPAPEEMLIDLQTNVAQVMGSVTKAADALAHASDELGTAARKVTGLLDTNQEKIDKAVTQANRTLDSVAKAAEDVDRLIGDERIQERFRAAMNDFPNTLEQMNRTMASAEMRLNDLQSFTQRLGSPEVVDRIDRGTKQLDTVMQDLTEFSQRLRNPNGSLALLLEDRQLYDHISQAAANVDELSRRMKPVVEDVRVFTDKIARHPEQLGVRGAIQRSPGIK